MQPSIFRVLMTDIKRVSYSFILWGYKTGWFIIYSTACCFLVLSATCSYNFSTIPAGMLSYGRIWLPKEITHNESKWEWKKRFTAKWHSVSTILVPDSSCFNNREQQCTALQIILHNSASWENKVYISTHNKSTFYLWFPW